MWIAEQLLGRGIVIALQALSDRDGPARETTGSEARTDAIEAIADATAEAMHATTTAPREER